MMIIPRTEGSQNILQSVTWLRLKFYNSGFIKNYYTRQLIQPWFRDWAKSRYQQIFMGSGTKFIKISGLGIKIYGQNVGLVGKNIPRYDPVNMVNEVLDTAVS